MNDIELEQALKKIYHKQYGDPPAPDVIWQRVAPCLTVLIPPVPWWKRVLQPARHVDSPSLYVPRNSASGFRLSRRLAITLVGVIVGLVVIASTTYASINGAPLDSLWKSFGIPSTVTRQFSDYHQSKSVDGYTITIQKAFADSNEVIIGFTAEAPAGGNTWNKFYLAASKLVTDQGTVLPPISGLGGTGTTSGTLLAFDTSSIQGNPKDLRLELSLPYGSQAQSAPFSVAGHLTFDIVVPFTPGKFINVNQSVTSPGEPVTKEISVMGGLPGGGQQLVHDKVTVLNGKTVTLRQVVISPSEVRFDVAGFSV